MSESERSSIILAQAATNRFPTRCSVLKPQSVEKRAKMSHFLTSTPAKFGEGWAECLSELI